MKEKIKVLIKKIALSIKYLRYVPQMIPACLLYLFLCGKRKKLLIEDLKVFHKVEYQRDILYNFTAFYRLMVDYTAFRNVFYYRSRPFHNFICWFMPADKTLAIRCLNIGGGLYIQHGTSSRIGGLRIGDNFFTNQNVTIGWKGSGIPTIGNNVRIGSGAVVIGGITIGDNVNIGANAIVTKDVPSNTTVVSPQAYICKRDGKRVHEEL